MGITHLPVPYGQITVHQMPHVELIALRRMIVDSNPLIFVTIGADISFIHHCSQSRITLPQIQIMQSNFFHIVFDIQFRSSLVLHLPIIGISQFDTDICNPPVGLYLLRQYFSIFIQTVEIISAQSDPVRFMS